MIAVVFYDIERCLPLSNISRESGEFWTKQSVFCSKDVRCNLKLCGPALLKNEHFENRTKADWRVLQVNSWLSDFQIYFSFLASKHPHVGRHAKYRFLSTYCKYYSTWNFKEEDRGLVLQVHVQGLPSLTNSIPSRQMCTAVHSKLKHGCWLHYLKKEANYLFIGHKQ